MRHAGSRRLAIGCLLLLAAPCAASEVLVVELSSGPSRELIVVVEGRAYRVHSIPQVVPDSAPDPVSPPGPADELAAAAARYAGASRDAAAAGYVRAADELAAGKSVAAALATGAQVSDQLRKQAFATHVGPTFGAVLPEGSEPATPAQRAEVGALWRRFAAALGEVNP